MKSFYRGKKHRLLLSLLFFAALNYMFTFSFAGNSTIIEQQEQRQPRKVNVLYIVDGEPMAKDEVDKLDLEEIDQIEHIRESEKIKQYTDEEVHMVVVIKLKKKDSEEQQQAESD
jgi:adenylylsulfate kinase-like enzyme